MTLTPSQSAAMQKLKGRGNVFLTGAAGTGKSHVIREYLNDCDKDGAMLATTGMAAIVINGRTFHSFFSLWDFNSPFEVMVKSALKNQRMQQRIVSTDEIIIDEVSMIDERTMAAAEKIARIVRENTTPWGGMRVIAVGDFCQLPPVDPGRKAGMPVDWIFDTQVWADSQFETAELTEIMRTGDTAFMDILNKVRRGEVDDDVYSFMESHRITEQEAEHIDGTRIFARLADVSDYNAKRMAEIDAPVETFEATVDVFSMFDQDKIKAKILKVMPVEATLELKPGALVMIRKNNLEQGYANGTLGHYKEQAGAYLIVTLLDGAEVQIERMEYTLKDGDGKVQAIAMQYPLSLAWASTIHKAQGATLDVVIADIGRLWDSGQAYVAMSRTKTAAGFHVVNWSRHSVIIDERVQEFYNFLPAAV
jgi:ATP-dependent exoDNAse (exonuclease V) alpha subunit